MTIDKAIKTGGSLPLEDRHIFSEDHAKAIKLGNEALKREKAHREHYSMRDPELFPGETKD